MEISEESANFHTTSVSKNDSKEREVSRFVNSVNMCTLNQTSEKTSR